MDLKDESIEWLMQSAATVEQVVKEKESMEMRVEEDRQLTLFLKTLQSMSIFEPLLEGPVAFGVLRNEEDFHCLLRKFKALGYFFAIRTSRVAKCPSPEKKILLKGPAIRNVKHPYIIEKCARLYCSAGRKHIKEVRDRSQHSERSQRASWPSDCKAVMKMRQVRIFSGISIPTHRARQLQVIRKLRQAFVGGFPAGDTELWVWVSLPRMHHHPPSILGHSLDPEVKATMHTLMDNRPLTAQEVKKKLRVIVQKEFSQERVKPSTDNTAFFPSEKVIYNHLRHKGLVRKIRERKTNVKTEREKIISRLMNLRTVIELCDDVKVLTVITTLLKQMEEILTVSSSGYLKKTDSQESSI